MRKNIFFILAGFFITSLQVSWLNVLDDRWTWNLPLVVLVLGALWLHWKDLILLAGPSLLALDYSSVFPFGTYVMVGAVVTVAAALAARRFPVRSHHALQVLLVSGASFVGFFLTLAIPRILALLHLGVWSMAPEPGPVLLGFISFLVLNLVLTLLWFVVGSILRRSFGRLLYFRHASH